jgi:hypothetical protein
MPHPLDQEKLRAWDSFRGRSAAADIAHAIGQTVDHQGRNIQTLQLVGSIARCNRGDGLTRNTGGIVATAIGAARSRGDFILIAGISRRADGTQVIQQRLRAMRAARRTDHPLWTSWR